MSRDTVPMQGGQSFRQTLRQGFQAMGGKDIPSYTLMYLDPTRNKMKGEYTQVLVPYAELGRGSKCTIRYGEEYPTVSRVHAAIQTVGGQTTIKHLGTNPTLVNGRPIQDSAVLQNGDEIQLSYEGPRLRFNATPSGAASMKFTRRMALYTSQALTPYKRGLAVMAVLLLLTIAGFGYWTKQQSDQIADQGSTIEFLQGQLDETNTQIAQLEEKAKKSGSGLSASDRKLLAALKAKKKETEEELGDQESATEEEEMTSEADSPSGSDADLSAADYFLKNKKDVYFIQINEIVITRPGREPIVSRFVEQTAEEGGKTLGGGGSGTGFLTSDGRLITARHVITPWRYRYFINSNQLLLACNLAEQEGGRVEAKYSAYSPDGDYFDFVTSEMKYSEYNDQTVVFPIEIETSKKKKREKNVSLKVDTGLGNSDWAYINLPGKKGSFNINLELSQKLKSGEKIYVSGYQNFGATFDPTKGLEPNYSESNVSQSNLVNGVIQTSNSGIGPGTSGGPAIVKRDGRFHLVGIATATFDGNNQGIITPVCNLR